MGIAIYYQMKSPAVGLALPPAPSRPLRLGWMSLRSISALGAGGLGPWVEALLAFGARRGGDLDRDASGEEVLRRTRRSCLTGDLVRLGGGEREMDLDDERLRPAPALLVGGERERETERAGERE
jgi:hypothetical protein